MDWKEYLQENQGSVVDELLAFIRIPSVSALPAHAADVAAAGAWVHARLEAAGLEHVQTLATGGHPVVYGDWLHAPGAPTVLIYGHFDVQPAVAEDGWSGPPFEPRLADDRIYARGASDDKGNMFAPIVAVEALLRTRGGLPVNVKFLLEGQEEIGSPQLGAFVSANRELLGCDLALSADGSQWSEREPTLLLSLRGICALQVDISGPRNDMHSGMYGGTIQNPAACPGGVDRRAARRRRPGGGGRVLRRRGGAHLGAARAVRQGTVRRDHVPGRHRRPRAVRRARLVHLRAGVGPAYTGGERHVGRIPGRGYQDRAAGNGPRQDYLPAGRQPAGGAHPGAGELPPDAPRTGWRAGALPAPARCTARPTWCPPTTPATGRRRRCWSGSTGVAPLHTGSGGSIPVCGLLLEELGIHTIGFSFALDDEGAHGPDEFFRLASFRRAQEAYCLILQELAAA